jgi:hypothetical protein
MDKLRARIFDTPEVEILLGERPRQPLLRNSPQALEVSAFLLQATGLDGSRSGVPSQIRATDRARPVRLGLIQAAAQPLVGHAELFVSAAASLKPVQEFKNSRIRKFKVRYRKIEPLNLGTFERLLFLGA